MDTQEYKITNKETGESHFAVPFIIGNETVTFKLQDTGEEIVFSNIGSVGDLQNELFTATIAEESFAEVQEILAAEGEDLEKRVIGQDEAETETAEAEEVTE